MQQENRAASILVVAEFSEEKVIASANQVRAELGADVSCAIAFVTPSYVPYLEDLLELIRVYGHVPILIGCTGEGIIGTGRELENKEGFSLLLLSLPNTTITPFEFGQSDVDEGNIDDWYSKSGIKKDAVDAWIVLGNPFRLAVDEWLSQWNEAYPGIPAIGGMCSVGEANPANAVVFHDGRAVKGEGVALALKGGVQIQTIVSQGCRPIGEPLTITNAQENLLFTLGSIPAYDILNQVFQGLTEKERSRAQGNLFAGLAMSEYVEDFKRGDFLIRNILGADPNVGAVAVGARLRVGQTMQYQLRDRVSADEDLRELCETVAAGASSKPITSTHTAIGKPFAHLLFSCNGRGRSLFRVANHDANILKDVFGPLPSTGFFCNGEIGPIGKTNFLHSYTASVALLCDLE